MAFDSIIRKSTVAGSFYPADPEALAGQINGFLEKVEPQDISNIKAIISPHAGYIYSGQVAAYSYKQLSGSDYDSIIVIAPSHREYFDFISVYHGDGYETPLGTVMIDSKRARDLADSSPAIERSHSGHGQEHSLEVQLPFLQIVLGNKIKIVPVVIGDQSRENIMELGNTIGRLFSDDNILIVASTDLSHYHPYDTAVALDKHIKELIGSYGTSQLLDDLAKNNAEMCGGGPVVSAMTASSLMGADSSMILHYANSGDAGGDKSAVVGYLSAAFYKK
ncbi:MAG: AmmeMemoRadiSam system protein B [Actinomycetia bacterium]|nr:AmmeMemoRadiSam system protein B [Actinomycetes bacterium]